MDYRTSNILFCWTARASQDECVRDCRAWVNCQSLFQRRRSWSNNLQPGLLNTTGNFQRIMLGIDPQPPLGLLFWTWNKLLFKIVPLFSSAVQTHLQVILTGLSKYFLRLIFGNLSTFTSCFNRVVETSKINKSMFVTAFHKRWIHVDNIDESFVFNRGWLSCLSKVCRYFHYHLSTSEKGITCQIPRRIYMESMGEVIICGHIDGNRSPVRSVEWFL